MCGIAGAIGSIDGEALRAVQRMTDAEAHRGPDQDGIWSSVHIGRGVALGHRRLSILDLSEAGRQPMIDPASGVVIVFNGEVYNFAEIARDLPDELVSRCDTEVILKAYARWGERAIDRMRGMFALALFDPRDETVLFARDRLGIKPLYYAEVDRRLIFASEVRAILASGLVERTIDERSLASFAWHGFVPGPRTIVEGVRLLPAGTTMRVGLDGRARPPKRYWSVPRSRPIDAETSVRELGDALNDAVKMRLIADVPLGIFLSGGVDSSAVAAIAQRVSRSPIMTFNIRFEEADYDESAYAREVATAIGTEHREVVLSERTFEGRLDDALASIDQPTFDAINTYFVSRAVREAGLTVALAGTGGDELFGGYPSFTELPRARAMSARMPALPAPVRRRLTRLVANMEGEVLPQTRWGKLGDVLDSRGDLLALYQSRCALFTRDLWRQLVLPDVELDWGLDPERAAELRAEIASEPELAAISRLELASFLGERLLRDTDAASMAVSLEVRVPLIDHVVVETLARVPEERRYAPNKALLLSLARLDPKLFDRPKAGFVLPLDRWCRRTLGPRVRETLTDVSLAARVGLDASVIGRVWRSFEQGHLYWSRVWALFVLLRFCDAHRLTRA